jgi:hypothetical protein
MTARAHGPGASAANRPAARQARLIALLLAGALSACSPAPRVPDWALDARGGLDRAVQADLAGQPRVAEAEYRRAREALASTAQPAAVARAELLRCAVRVASLDTGAPAGAGGTTVCPAFEPWRADAGPELQAYADWLDGRAAAAAIALLPAAQRAAAAAGRDTAAREAAVRAIDDPLSRLLAAAIARRDGAETPGLLALAIDTASAEGWRRPLHAWLLAERQRARAAGDRPRLEAIERRLAVLGVTPPAAAAPR